MGRLSNVDSDNLILERLYEKYLEKVLRGEMFSKSKFGIVNLSLNSEENIFLEFRETSKGQLSSAQEKYLLSKLSSRIGKWFVPYVLDTVDDFSNRLMKELLETSIKVWDPSLNYCFIRPALRVYQIQVYDYILDRFEKSTDTEKGGILRALYWVEPKSVWRKETGEIQEDYQLKYRWNEKGYYERDYDESENEIIHYKDEISLRLERKIELLSNEYQTTRNKRLKGILRAMLPKELRT